jgi:L-asparagine oxygenase
MNCVTKSLRENGFAFIPQFSPELETEAVAQNVGVVERLPNRTALYELKPKEKESSTRNLYSGNFGYDAFPVHTDLAHWFVPPRYILFRSRKGHKLVQTILMRSSDVVAKLPSHVIRRARLRSRRLTWGRRQLLPVLQRRFDDILFRWDSLFLIPDNQEALTVSEAVTREARISATEFSLINFGDTLILDNWRTLHGRSAVPPEARTRHIDRVYLREIG